VKKKVSKKITSKKNSKKIEVVFGDSKKVVKKNKPIVHSKKPIIKKVVKKNKFIVHSKKSTINKKHKPVSHVVKVSKTHKHKEHKTKVRKKSKDFLIIGILLFLIVAIVVVSFLIPANDPNSIVNNTDNNLNTVIVDNNFTDTNVSDINVDDFQARALELNLNILNDMKDYQQNILSNAYFDLNLNEEQMNSCLVSNKYLQKDANMFDFKEVSSIQRDFILSQSLYVSQTPTLFVNGYSLLGFNDYNTVTNFISAVDNTDSLVLDYTNKSFVSDSNSLKLYAVYDVNNELINNANLEFIDYLKNSDTLVDSVREIFTETFTTASVEYVQYNSEKGKSILQTIDVNALPAFYLTGDINYLDFNLDADKTVFNLIFNKEPVNNGFVIKQDVLLQFNLGQPINGVYKLIDYKSIIDSNTIFIGDSDAKVSMVLFTDYDEPNSLKLENETLTNQFYTDYVDTGKVSVVIKPVVTNDVFSIYPILFLKCAEAQNATLKTHKKIFELNPVIGVKSVYDVISVKYADELSILEAEYAKITGTLQGN
jgi:hypothetical protein